MPKVWTSTCTQNGTARMLTPRMSNLLTASAVSPPTMMALAHTKVVPMAITSVNA